MVATVSVQGKGTTQYGGPLGDEVIYVGGGGQGGVAGYNGGGGRCVTDDPFGFPKLRGCRLYTSSVAGNREQ
jgi:hypothetical protein